MYSTKSGKLVCTQTVLYCQPLETRARIPRYLGRYAPLVSVRIVVAAKVMSFLSRSRFLAIRSSSLYFQVPYQSSTLSFHKYLVWIIVWLKTACRYNTSSSWPHLGHPHPWIQQCQGVDWVVEAGWVSVGVVDCLIQHCSFVAGNHGLIMAARPKRSTTDKWILSSPFSHSQDLLLAK